MEIISEKDLKLLKTLAGLTQEELLKSLKGYLKGKYKDIIVNDRYVVGLGTIPVALIAHCDTVFKVPPTESDIFYDKDRNALWSKRGGLGDDRRGVFAIMKIIQAGFRPTVIFVADEEVGGLGSMQLVEDFPKPFQDYAFLIELDRRGTCDCVFYDCDNPEFTEYVESFGFIENFGSFTDICEICPVWGMAGVNLSIGYEDEHSIAETLHLNPLFQTIKKVKNILSQSEHPHFKFIERKYISYPYPYSYDWNFENWYNTYPTEDDPVVTCKLCGHRMSEFESFEMPYKGSDAYVCIDCAAAHCDYCRSCGELFETKLKKCPYCSTEIKKIDFKGAKKR